jgi:tripartite-type tricarboxylate transporter receptor subunit TctC
MRFAIPGIFAAVIATASPSAVAQPFPSQPIQFIVPFAAGGSTDVIARLLADAFAKIAGWQVVVENRPGGAGAAAAGALAQAAPTGHTLLVLSAETQTRRVLEGYAAVGMIAKSPQILVTNASGKFASAKDLVAAAKDTKVDFAVAGIASAAALSRFQAVSDTRFGVVRGTAAMLALQNVMADQVAASFVNPAAAENLVRAGRLRALGVAARRRLPQLPDVPTLTEVGFANAVYESWVGLVAPKGTPPDIIAVINKTLLAAIGQQDFTVRLASIGYQPRPSTPQGFAEAVDEAGGLPICGDPCPDECGKSCDSTGCCVLRN